MNFNEYVIKPVVKFNWEIVKQHTNSDAQKILEFFDNVYVRKSENYFYLNPWAAMIVKESSGKSQSYIQNISGLLSASRGATSSEILVYLDLVAKRSYFNFVNTKGVVNYLPKWKIDNYEINSLEMNRLLTFDEHNIYMIYEGEI